MYFIICRKYPDVKEAADKALVTLKTMRDSYVAEVMRRNDDGPKLVSCIIFWLLEGKFIRFHAGKISIV
jgi:hypothetical protein